MLFNTNSFKAKEKSEYELTCQEIKKLKQLIQNNEHFFNMTDDELLIDYCIYQQSALLARYEHLIKQAKLLSGPTQTKEQETVAGVVK